MDELVVALHGVGGKVGIVHLKTNYDDTYLNRICLQVVHLISLKTNHAQQQNH